jgi:hypothetical protein
MKSGYTDISIVLDRSGSMQSVKSDTIGGFNAFLEDQQKAGGEATITLAQFDDVYEVVYSAIPLANAKPLDDKTFVPRGSTALLDAIGRTIHGTGRRLEGMPESKRPEKVIFVILTDGEENASKEFPPQKINEMISHQRDVYKWDFVFLGANQDAITTAANLGVPTQNALTYVANSAGTQQAFGSLSKNVANYRAGRSRGVDFSEEDREKQRKAGAWKPTK